MKLLFLTTDEQGHAQQIQAALPEINSVVTNDLTTTNDGDLVIVYPECLLFIGESPVMPKCTVALMSEKNISEQIALLDRGFDFVWVQNEVLVEQIKALFRLLRKYRGSETIIYNDGEFKLSSTTAQVWVEGHEIQLTASEYQLLALFAEHPNRIYSREELLFILDNEHGMERVIDTHVKNLRKKMTLQQRQFQYIRTIHGRGYRFEFEEDGGDN